MPLPDSAQDAGTTLSAPMQTPHADLVAGLRARRAWISPKYFYDARGSALFEYITRLPEYYPTRTEQQIMAAQAAELARQIAPGATIIEWGAGNCDKAQQLCEWLDPAHFVALDISVDCLQRGAARLQAACPGVQVRALAADLTGDWALPEDVPLARRLLFFPGSSIGNFDAPQRLDLLRRMRRLLDDDGALLIGVDLVKPVPVLEAAYNDAAGVTAAFNRNMLRHVNRLIGSDFVEDGWEHCAFFNPELSRIEMHLQARADTVVRWPGQLRSFARGERIHTENSYKFSPQGFADLLARAGFKHTQSWTDDQAWYGVVLARP